MTFLDDRKPAFKALFPVGVMAAGKHPVRAAPALGMAVAEGRRTVAVDDGWESF